MAGNNVIEHADVIREGIFLALKTAGKRCSQPRISSCAPNGPKALKKRARHATKLTPSVTKSVTKSRTEAA